MESIEAEICDEHASEAAFLWTLRDEAAQDWAYDLRALAELDERLEAHVDGLRLSGEPGLSACLSALGDGADAGEAFAAALLALERHDLRRFARVLDVAGGNAAARGIVSALGWASVARVRWILPGLLAASCPPSLHCIGIRACAVHREDPGAALGYALCAADERLLVCALKTAGELGRRDLLADVRAQARSSSAACRYWAGWSGALLGDAAAAEDLWSIAAGGGAYAERAAATAMRRIDPRRGASWLSAMAGAGVDARAALAGAAALGDPALVPWLLERMEQPETARRAGLAFTMITGADLEEAGLAGKVPPGLAAGPSDDPNDEDVAMDPDESLPWPDIAAVRGLWDRERARFQQGARYLLGRPLAPEWLEEVLRSGRQPVREAAAMELVLGGHRRALPEVRSAVFNSVRNAYAPALFN